MSHVHLAKGGQASAAGSGSNDAKWLAGMAIVSAVVFVTAYLSLGIFAVPSTQGVPNIMLGSVDRSTFKLN